MKLGVLTVPLYDRSVEEAFAWLHAHGVQAVEIGTGGYTGNDHCDPAALLADEVKLQSFKDLLAKYGLEISAFSCHSNHVHPNEDIRGAASREFTATLRLAEKLNVDTVITFSGCPGDYSGARYPNWVTCAWPEDYQKILDYQWNGELVPFWQSAVAEAAEYGIEKIALEMHPGFCVYNTETLLRLREAAGHAIGANFDPSHLYWQGMEPAESIHRLSGAIYHFHAKDVRLQAYNTAVNGVLDTREESISGPGHRPWLFRTVGYGHGAAEWREMLSALRLAGYGGAISIEHEDVLMSAEEGLEKAIDFLKPMVFRNEAGDIFWK